MIRKSTVDVLENIASAVHGPEVKVTNPVPIGDDPTALVIEGFRFDEQKSLVRRLDRAHGRAKQRVTREQCENHQTFHHGTQTSFRI